MSALREILGLLRSLLMYYAIPGRFGRLQRFYAEFVRPGDLCFDVGAHVGNRLQVWHSLGARCVAFEPQPRLFDYLQRRFGAEASITLLPLAVGAAAGTATLHISTRTPTVTSLSTEWIASVQRDASFRRVAWDKAVEVELTTLDAMIACHGVPRFCKIDVEGFELAVLQGLTHPLPVLSFEYIAAALPMAQQCILRLEQLGRYQYQYSPGETHRLAAPRWLDAAEMLVLLKTLKGSGDVYARLVGPLASLPIPPTVGPRDEDMIER